MMTKVIDVSKWNGIIDYRQVVADEITGVIIRAGFGTHVENKDPYFDVNYRNAKSVGLKVGAYWYSYADTLAAARIEVQACLAVIKDKKFEYPIYYDIEEKAQLLKGKNFCSGIASIWCDAMTLAGYYPGIYASSSHLTDYIDLAKGYPIWVAQYASTCTHKKAYGMWQYTNKGQVKGVKTDCDMNECYVDYPAYVKEQGINGYKKIKPVSVIVSEVIAGKWGNGQIRKEKLVNAGYNYEEIQKQVNTILTEKAKEKEAENIYIVKKGDTLTAIAKKYGTTVNKLKSLNKLKNANLIKIGQQIRLK